MNRPPAPIPWPCRPGLTNGTRRRSLRPRGMMLVDVLTAVLLLSVFAFAATRLLSGILRASRATDEAARLNAGFDAAVDQLRRDVWSATKISVTDGSAARLERPEGPPVEWTLGEGGELVRTVAAAQPDSPPERAAWPGAVGGVTFAAEGPVLVLVEQPKAGIQGRRVPFVSQLGLAATRPAAREKGAP